MLDMFFEKFLSLFKRYHQSSRLECLRTFSPANCGLPPFILSDMFTDSENFNVNNNNTNTNTRDKILTTEGVFVVKYTFTLSSGSSRGHHYFVIVNLLRTNGTIVHKVLQQYLGFDNDLTYTNISIYTLRKVLNLDLKKNLSTNEKHFLSEFATSGKHKNVYSTYHKIDRIKMYHKRLNMVPEYMMSALNKNGPILKNTFATRPYKGIRLLNQFIKPFIPFNKRFITTRR